MKLEKEKNEKNDLLNEMEKLSKSKVEFEDEVFEKVYYFYFYYCIFLIKFTLILNEKKKKIKSLKKMMQDQANAPPKLNDKGETVLEKSQKPGEFHFL